MKKENLRRFKHGHPVNLPCRSELCRKITTSAHVQTFERCCLLYCSAEEGLSIRFTVYPNKQGAVAAILHKLAPLKCDELWWTSLYIDFEAAMYKR